MNHDEYRDPKEVRAPITNTLEKKDFEGRIAPVFQNLENILSKSFGPYGSNTIICDYPYTSTTKDGWTIMKNILFADPLDRAIAQMVTDICGRLNNTVGDGTTTAIIATNALYREYINTRDKVEGIPPREIISTFHKCADAVVDCLQKNFVHMMDTTNEEEFGKAIRNVVRVSSNGDETLTEIIGSIYDELKFPAIDIQLAADGITKKKVVDGYAIDTSLTDKLYINNDNKTAVYTNMDVVIFEHKVTTAIFRDIIMPLNMQCAARGRHLLVIAPFYDEHAIDGIIRDTLNAEYRRNKDINIVLAVCSARNEKDRKCLSDLAMLFNTVPISNATADEIIKMLSADPNLIAGCFNMDYRKIPNIRVFDVSSGNFKISDGTEYKVLGENKFVVDLGFCEYAELGLKNSIFRGFWYDEDLYKIHYAEAEQALTDATEKYKAMGTFNLETSWARQRLSALKLKMATIEVGGESQLSQGMMRDVVDDAVKAAASAFNNGTVLGCHVCLRKAIQMCKENTIEALEMYAYDLLYNAFCRVHETLLRNKYNGSIGSDNYVQQILHYAENPENGVYDIVADKLSKDIITSADTDIQILRATMDLTSLLVSGNQFVYRHLQGSEF